MKSVLVSCIVFMLFAEGIAIRCYECSACNEKKELDSSDIVECEEEQNACTRVHLNEKNQSGNDVYRRSCATGLKADVESLEYTCSASDEANIKETCICYHDLCNDAGIPNAKTTVIIPLVFISSILLMLM
ncbi:uncharacterized protein LOC120341024 [Styela clava]|uniref:uncharacterized protein LOC120341024 n=1 Tax=Styela clava TaxID=7725 RepID=UPI00193AD947|nr:uncharacterized protein LOC120341024 [Styela clava]XP_039265376.1 uncharacterized protein LOC120341024 [Styela clava]